MKQNRHIHLKFMSIFTAAAFAVGIGTSSSSADAAALDWAYVWADQPTSSSYTPHLSYQANSTGATNTVTRFGVGSYRVILPNLTANAGTVHVTAYGTGNETCKVASWGPSSNGSNEQVNVLCFTSTGSPVDTRFTMSFTHPKSTLGSIAFVWANQPTLSSYTPSIPFQFNSSGATNTITRLSMGQYKVVVPGFGGDVGHVQVTAYGTGSERCKVISWGPIGSTEQVFVACFTSTGLAVDTRFTMTYVNQLNLIGGRSFGSGSTGQRGPTGAYAWGSSPTATSYTAPAAYAWQDGTQNSPVMISRLGIGSYRVDFPDLGPELDGGDVQVTAYGTGSEYCKVASWTSANGVQVRCFNNGGAPVDTQFDATFLGIFEGF